MVIKMKKYIVIILIVGLFVSIILGFYLYKLNKIEEQIAFETEYKKVETENIMKNVEEILKETSSTEEKISPNTKLIEKIYYNECGHLVEQQKTIKQEFLNKTEEEFKTEYAGWEIQKFTSNEIVIYKEIDNFCNEHYILKDVEGEIIVYSLDKNDNEREIVKETGIKTKYLSEVDIENLKIGIKVYSNKELNQILEDFE